jgi:hypothetical protein
MHKQESKCRKLSELTAEVLYDVSLRQRFVSVQQNNMKLCVKSALDWYNIFVKA